MCIRDRVKFLWQTSTITAAPMPRASASESTTASANAPNAAGMPVQTAVLVSLASVSYTHLNMHDVDYFAAHFEQPAFCFTPDAEFPVCNGEKGGFGGELVSPVLENGVIVDFVGGVDVYKRQISTSIILQNISCRILWVISVSYTHLDVYKRQLFHCGGGKGCAGLFKPQLRVLPCRPVPHLP